MLIFGFAMMVIVPFIFYFFLYTEGPNREASANQALIVARRVVDNAEVVYSLGEASRTSLRVYIPTSVSGSMIVDNAVIFQVSMSGGMSDVAYPSQVNISGTLPNSSGVFMIHLESLGDYVNISYS